MYDYNVISVETGLGATKTWQLKLSIDPETISDILVKDDHYNPLKSIIREMLNVKGDISNRTKESFIEDLEISVIHKVEKMFGQEKTNRNFGFIKKYLLK